MIDRLFRSPRRTIFQL